MSYLQDKICSLEKEAASGGKTKLLSLSGSVNRIVKVAAVQIEAIDRFAYLGCIIAAGGGTDIIILTRTPEIGQGLERILSCGTRKPEQT